jgi:hypothetical protein
MGQHTALKTAGAAKPLTRTFKANGIGDGSFRIFGIFELFVGISEGIVISKI